MSTEWTMNVEEDELVEFLASEYTRGSGIPVHLFCVINATFSGYNRSLGITNDFGTLFFQGNGVLTGYGNNNPIPLIRALERCGVNIR
jgi:hypothetical protein